MNKINNKKTWRFGGGTFLSPDLHAVVLGIRDFGGQECPPSEAHKVFRLRIAANNGLGSQ